MNTDTIPAKKVHHGRNVKRLRDILGIKQEHLAFELNLSQQTISNLETKEIIDDETLNKIAEVLKVPVDAIKNYDEQATVSFIVNTINNHDTSSVYSYNNTFTFNPIDKIVELYERLLSEKDKNTK
jgi:transcriptional regulator with XRE-family HTH domain